MQWDFGSIVQHIKNLLGSSGMAPETETYLKNLINIRIGNAPISFAIDELRVPDQYVRSVADYSTGTVSVTNGSTAVSGTDTIWTYKMIGRKIRIGNDRNFYVVANVTAATTLVLDRKYIGDDDTDATYTIFENSFDLPVDLVWVKGVFDVQNEHDPLLLEDWDWIESIDPSLQHTGDVRHYALIGNKTLREPAISGTNTADATTSTTTLVDSALLSTENDYYNNWTLVNVTAGKTAIITDYVGSTKTLTIDEAIDAQEATDTYFLISNRPQITFYRRPVTEKDFLIKGYKRVPKLINDYDIPIIGEDFLDWVASGVLEIWYGKDDFAKKWAAIATEEEERLRQKYAHRPESKQREGMLISRGRELTFNVQDWDA